MHPCGEILSSCSLKTSVLRGELLRGFKIEEPAGTEISLLQMVSWVSTYKE